MKAAIEVLEKLMNAREAMRRRHAENYRDKVAEYRGYLAAAKEKWSCDDLQALMRLLKLLQEKEPGSGMHQALLMAAYVEGFE